MWKDKDERDQYWQGEGRNQHPEELDRDDVCSELPEQQLHVCTDEKKDALYISHIRRQNDKILEYKIL